MPAVLYYLQFCGFPLLLNANKVKSIVGLAQLASYFIFFFLLVAIAFIFDGASTSPVFLSYHGPLNMLVSSL